MDHKMQIHREESKGVVWSTTKDANAYRSELTVMYGGLAFTMALCCLHGVINRRFQAGYDNKKALFLLSKNIKRIRQQRKHADIF